MRWMTKSGGILCAFLFLGSAAALADDQFKGDGSMGGLMPDFAQDQGQPNKGICSAAAIADALWYLDQHGFGGLVAHTNANTPNTPWKNDAKALVLDVAEQIFGKDYVMNKQGARILAGMERGTLNYLRSKNFHLAIPNGRPALTVRRYDGANATYEWWQYYGQVNAFYPAVGDFTWRTAQGFPVTAKDGMGRDVALRHAMTAAGRDTMVEKTFVTMGWKDHPADQPPYQKPPYGEDETPYIDTYIIQTMGAVGSRRMRLPKQDANLFNRTAAEFIALDAIDAIQNPKINFKTRTPLPPAGLSPDIASGMGAGQRRYEYGFENTSVNDFAAMQFFLQIAVPFDLSSIIAPDGWNYLLWDPKLTPEITPSPPALTEAGELVDPNAGAWEPDFSGLLFYTLNDEFSVLPGETLGGFSFATDAIYSFREDAAFAGVSSRPVGLVDAGYEGSTTEYGFVGGPVMVAEPSTCLLIMGIVPLVRLRTRRRVRLTRRFAIARLSPAVAC